MATVDSLVTDIQTWTLAGITGSSTVLSAPQCTEFINATIRRLQRHHPWQFQTTSVTLIVPGGSIPSITLPADFVAELAVASVDASQSSPSSALVPIQKTLQWMWFDAVDPLATRDPQFPSILAVSNLTLSQDRRYYFIVDDQLWIVPTPSSKITIFLEYERTLAELVAAQSPAMTNPFLMMYPDAVRFGALAEAYWYLQDDDSATRMEALFVARRDEAVRHDNAIHAGGQGGSRGK